jgi:hypothetical protein
MNLLKDKIEKIYEDSFVEVRKNPNKLIIYSSKYILDHIENNFEKILEDWKMSKGNMFINLDISELDLLMNQNNYLLNYFKNFIQNSKYQINQVSLEKQPRIAIFLNGEIQDVEKIHLLFHNFKLFIYFKINPEEEKNYQGYDEKNVFTESIDLSSFDEEIIQNFIKFMEKGKWVTNGKNRIQKMKNNDYKIVENISTGEKSVAYNPNKSENDSANNKNLFIDRKLFICFKCNFREAKYILSKCSCWTCLTCIKTSINSVFQNSSQETFSKGEGKL